MPQPIPTRIYRIAHLDNLPAALRHGLFCRNHPAPPTAAYRAIGDADLTARRGTKAVPVAPGGTLNDYVPFYLGPRSPMLYRIGKHAPQADIVYLVSHVQHLQRLNLPYVFTDGHAYEAFTAFYHDPGQLPQLAWDDIYADYWKPTPDNPHRQRHKQAELLVHTFVPPAALLGLAVHNEDVRVRVELLVSQAGLALPVAVLPAWYY